MITALPPKSKILEIGTYKCVLEILNQVPESTATVIFKTSDTEKLFYENNLNDRITVQKGKSSDKLLELFKLNETFNFIYINASHRCLDVYLDAMIAWKLLKIGGIIAFDETIGIACSPYNAIEQFKKNYPEDFVIIAEDYRVYLKKIN